MTEPRVGSPPGRPGGGQLSGGSSWLSTDADEFDRLKVFVSSVSEGYEQLRAAARCLVEALGHEPVLIGETSPALPRTPQRACLTAVADCEVTVLLLGSKYGTVQPSDKSATHEEWEHARDLGKDILVFKERVKPEGRRQRNFIQEVRDYEHGRPYKEFKTVAELQQHLVAALRRIEQERRDAADFASRLPERVRCLLESMRGPFPDSLARTQRLLAAAASGEARAISRIAEHPPVWAMAPGPLVWEVLAEFLDASLIADASHVRGRAIEAGSERRNLYFARNAIAAAEAGETGEQTDEADAGVARQLADQIPVGDPLHAVTMARVEHDCDGLLKSATDAGLGRSEDLAVRDLAAALISWAHCCKGQIDEALAVLDSASLQHPAAPWLLLARSRLAFGLGGAPGHGTVDADLLERASELALDARDRLRELGGPSRLAVPVACEARLILGDTAGTLRVGRPAPEGEATEAEAADPSVQRVVAEALLDLERHDGLDQLDLDSLEPWLSKMLRARQAHARGDPAARPMMLRAFDEAHEPAERKRVAFELALMGEPVDEASVSLTEAEAALLRGLAASERGDPGQAVEALRGLAAESLTHAHCLWRAQHGRGDTQAAIGTLEAAVEHFGPDPLSADLVELLVNCGQSAQAEAAALDALARIALPDTRRRLRTALVHLAEAAGDWHKAHEHAAALHRESPQHSAAAWAAVHALAQQGRHEEARVYLRTHRLTPASEETAHLAALVLGGPAAPAIDAAVLLELAHLFPQSELVAATVLMALMNGGDRVTLTDGQRDAASDLLEAFIERFPTSQILRRVQASSAEELAELMRDVERRRSGAIDWNLVEEVYAGRAPFGLLSPWSPSYAGLLIDSDCDGGYLTAVSDDPETLEREIETAVSVIGGDAVIDTSVAVLTSRAGLSLDTLSGVFAQVLVPDQLLADASRAVERASLPADATVWYEPTLKQLAFKDVSERERNRRVEFAENVAIALRRCLGVSSGGARPQWYPDSLAEPFVWDAAVRVAAVRGCALWSDDAAMRHLAEALGVTTFGTYALYEALEKQTPDMALPGTPEVKMSLLRARIADIPMDWVELADGTDDSEGPDSAWDLWFRRSATWRDPAVASAFAHRIRELEDRWVQHLPRLVHSACRGFAPASGDRRQAVGWVLARALLELREPERAAARIVEAARAAGAGHGRPRPSDPLPAAAEMLLAAFEADSDPDEAARRLLSVFAALPPDDLRIVARTIGSMPDNSVPMSNAERGAGRSRRPRRPRTRPRPRDRAPEARPTGSVSDFGAALRRRRLALGLTQQDLADRCGMARARISAVESSAARPRIGTLMRLAREMRSSLSLASSSARPAFSRTGMTSLHSLGRALRAAREELGWRQQDLADRSGVNRAQISKIENAGSDPLTVTLLRLVEALGLVTSIDHNDDGAFELDDIIGAHSFAARASSEDMS